MKKPIEPSKTKEVVTTIWKSSSGYNLKPIRIPPQYFGKFNHIRLLKYSSSGLELVNIEQIPNPNYEEEYEKYKIELAKFEEIQEQKRMKKAEQLRKKISKLNDDLNNLFKE